MSLRLLPVLVLALACAGCETAMHNMYLQPRLTHQKPTGLFPDHSATQLPPDGTVAYSAGVAADASSGRRGRVEWPAQHAQGRAAPYLAVAAATPAPAVPTDMAELQRGRSRFDIDCAPCHGLLGDGNGIIALRGFPHPPTYHQKRLRDAPDSHFDNVITNGYGMMFPYGDRVTPQDRRAIIAYIRALQLSQDAKVSELSAEDRRALGVDAAAAGTPTPGTPAPDRPEAGTPGATP
jgi:mono/diheme cytochrome c family protein